MANSSVIINLPKRIALLVIVIFALYYTFRRQIWSIESRVNISHATESGWGGESITKFIKELRQSAPPKITKPTTCIGGTIAVNDVTDASQRRNGVPLSKEEVKSARDAHEHVVDIIQNSRKVVSYTPHTKGIVIVGGGKYTGTVLVSLRMLRKTNSTLPVEVFMPNPEDYDKYTCEVVMPSLNAKCVAIPRYDGLVIEKYQYKIFAMILSSFEDVLFLDADNFPLADPAKFLEAQPFKNTGYVLWPDFWMATASPHYFEVVNRPVPSLFEYGTTESGQMLISKRTHWDTLLLVLYYNIFGPNFYYRIMTQCDAGEGDKETWLYAAHALAKPYYQIVQKIGVAGYHAGERWNAAGMLQYNPTQDWEISQKEETRPLYRQTEGAEVAFVHHNAIKLTPVDMLPWMASDKPKERMWGDKDNTVKNYGRDVEGEIWDELLYVGCNYGKALVGWSDNVCVKLTEYWGNVVAKEAREEVKFKFGSSKELHKTVS